jgi:hypothetical protein
MYLHALGEQGLSAYLGVKHELKAIVSKDSLWQSSTVPGNTEPNSLGEKSI